jgi:hypothetical protein
MRIIPTLALFCIAASPCLAGGEPSHSYYPAPEPYYAPPVIVTAPPPNPLASIVLGVIGLPFTVLGGIATAIAPPPVPLVPSCVGPDGSLFACPPGPAPGYPPPGYGGQEPPLPPATYLPQ